MQTLHNVTKSLLIKAAVNPASNSVKKSRILMLYEKGIITAGEVERMFSNYDLKGA